MVPVCAPSLAERRRAPQSAHHSPTPTRKVDRIRPMSSAPSEGTAPSNLAADAEPHRPEIDGLRALAVLPVILFHAGFAVFRTVISVVERSLARGVRQRQQGAGRPRRPLTLWASWFVATCRSPGRNRSDSFDRRRSRATVKYRHRLRRCRGTLPSCTRCGSSHCGRGRPSAEGEVGRMLATADCFKSVAPASRGRGRWFSPCPKRRNVRSLTRLGARSMTRFRLSRGSVLVVAVGARFRAAAAAHHSYAMFDGTRTLTVKGTLAKLEWTNPHVFVWVYVPNAARERLRSVRVRKRFAERAGAPRLVEDDVRSRRGADDRVLAA